MNIHDLESIGFETLLLSVSLKLSKVLVLIFSIDISASFTIFSAPSTSPDLHSYSFFQHFIFLIHHLCCPQPTHHLLHSIISIFNNPSIDFYIKFFIEFLTYLPSSSLFSCNVTTNCLILLSLFLDHNPFVLVWLFVLFFIIISTPFFCFVFIFIVQNTPKSYFLQYCSTILLLSPRSLQFALLLPSFDVCLFHK